MGTLTDEENGNLIDTVEGYLRVIGFCQSEAYLNQTARVQPIQNRSLDLMSYHHFDKLYQSSVHIVQGITSQIKSELGNHMGQIPFLNHANVRPNLNHLRKSIPVNLNGCTPMNMGSRLIEKDSTAEMHKTVHRRPLQDVEISNTRSNGKIAESSFRKKKRQYVYGKQDTPSCDDTPPESSDKGPKSDFKSALEKYEDDLIKEGKTSNLEPSKTKKRKNGFVSPFRSEEDGDSTPPGKRKKDPIEDSPFLKGVDPEMIERIQNEILDINLNVHWEDIAGLEDVKKTLHEMIILPNQHPDMFTGLRAPPKGLLLFGPPGNGKTMIAKAIATEANLTFFSISASILCSKWIGEGEKTVRALFALARAKQPSFIFIDEIDSILCSRSTEEHESSRRLKNEFLLQFEGATTSSNDRITIMGATNRPFDLDDAARRRLPKRVYVPLPEWETRKKMLMHLLRKENHTLAEKDFDIIAERLQGYSCNDIHQICQNAAMGPIRDQVKSGGLSHDVNALRSIDFTDFTMALDNIRPSVAPEDCNLYEDFANKFGTKGF